MGMLVMLAGLLLGTAPPASPPSAEPELTPEVSGRVQGPAWQVEAPGALGVRYGIGADFLFDRVDEIDVVRGQRVFSFVHPRTGERVEESQELDPGRVALDPEWEQQVVGVQLPVALSTGRIFTTLVIEAAAVDGSFELHDPRNDEPDDFFPQLVDDRQRPRTTLEGRGNRFGLGLETAGSLCGACRWSWSGGYRFRTIRQLDLEDESLPRPDLAAAVEQEGELESDDHELTARLGYRAAGGRFTPWFGVRGSRRESDLEHTRTLESLGPAGSVQFDERLRLETEAERIAALVGADFRLGRSLVGRVEGTFGDGGESVLVKVVSFPGLWGGDGASPPADRAPQPRRSADRKPTRQDPPEEVERQRRRADQLADELAPRADALRQRFDERARQLLRDAGPRGALPAGAVRALLDEIEAELRQMLDAPELRPTLAWFVDFAERSRRALDAPPSVSHHRSPSPRPTGSYRLAAFSPAPQPEEDGDPADPGRGIVAAIGRFLDTLTARADSRQLAQPLCVRSLPKSGAYVFLSAALPGSDEKPRRTDGRWDVFYRGLYAYRAELADRRFSCLPGSDCSAFLDFWDDNGPFVVCDFDAGLCVIDQGDGDTCGGR